jgi:hypothetical protein
MCWSGQTNKLSFSAIYLLFTLLIAVGFFTITFYRRALKQALILSLLSLVGLITLFVVFLTIVLNNM